MRRAWAPLLIAFVGVVTLLAVAGVMATSSRATMPGPCPMTTTAVYNNSLYWTCSAEIHFAPISSDPSNHVTHTYVKSHNVSFDLFGYETYDCPVVNVSGHEANGSMFSFLIAKSPLTCNGGIQGPVKLSPDGDVGGSWAMGDSYVILYVRAA